MAARDVVKYFNIFVDGRGKAGESTSFTPPNLTLVTEEFRAGGMAAPVALTMGMEALNSSFSLQSYSADVLALFGVTEGRDVSFIVREMLESFDGTATGVQHIMRGKITSIEHGERTPGALNPMNVTMNLQYYKLIHGDRTIHEIDVVNMVQVIDGSDLLSIARGLIGL